VSYILARPILTFIVPRRCGGSLQPESLPPGSEQASVGTPFGLNSYLEETRYWLPLFMVGGPHLGGRGLLLNELLKKSQEVVCCQKGSVGSPFQPIEQLP
jgi:hypothetical protein